jgi:hypothetical protein
MDASSAAVGGALEAPLIVFPPMEGASWPARWLGLAPRFDVMATLEKGPCYTTLLAFTSVNDADTSSASLLTMSPITPPVTYRTTCACSSATARDLGGDF